MSLIKKSKVFSKQWFIDYGLILAGSMIMAAGFAFFADPHRIVPGGAYGIAIVLHHTIGLPTGLGGLLVNIPLFIIGILVLGPRFGVKTFVGVILTSFFMDFFSHFSEWLPYYKDGLMVSSSTQGALPVTDNVLLASIVAAVLIGGGLGIIFKAKATTGGSDIIAMIFAKKTNIPVGKLLIFVDSAIVTVGIVAFKDPQLAIYALITIFITGKVIDTVLVGQSYYKGVFIISDKHEQIREKLLHDLKRGGTYFSGKGMYNDENKQVIFTAVNGRELTFLQSWVKEIDPSAFITVFNAHDIRGLGFKTFDDEN